MCSRYEVIELGRQAQLSEFKIPYTNQGRIQDLEQGVLKAWIVTQRCSATPTFLMQLSAMYAQKQSTPRFAPEKARLQDRHPSCYFTGLTNYLDVSYCAT